MGPPATFAGGAAAAPIWRATRKGDQVRLTLERSRRSRRTQSGDMWGEDAGFVCRGLDPVIKTIVGTDGVAEACSATDFASPNIIRSSKYGFQQATKTQNVSARFTDTRPSASRRRIPLACRSMTSSFNRRGEGAGISNQGSCAGPDAEGLQRVSAHTTNQEC